MRTGNHGRHVIVWRGMRFLRLAIAIGMAACLAAAPARQVVACTCMEFTPQQALETADAAFSGTVTRAAPGPQDPNGLSPTIFIFAVDGVAKGAIGPEVAIAAGGDSAACGISFGIGERWMIFAYSEKSTLATGLCGGNVSLAAGEAPPVPVEAPTGPASPEDSSFVLPVPLLVATSALALLGVVSAWAFSRRREL